VISQNSYLKKNAALGMRILERLRCTIITILVCVAAYFTFAWVASRGGAIESYGTTAKPSNVPYPSLQGPADVYIKTAECYDLRSRVNKCYDDTLNDDAFVQCSDLDRRWADECAEHTADACTDLLDRTRKCHKGAYSNSELKHWRSLSRRWHDGCASRKVMACKDLDDREIKCYKDARGDGDLEQCYNLSRRWKKNCMPREAGAGATHEERQEGPDATFAN
jgi:hypothetical protein